MSLMCNWSQSFTLHRIYKRSPMKFKRYSITLNDWHKKHWDKVGFLHGTTYHLICNICDKRKHTIITLYIAPEYLNHLDEEESYLMHMSNDGWSGWPIIKMCKPCMDFFKWNEQCVGAMIPISNWGQEY